VAPELRAELWPFLLGVYDPSTTEAERAAEASRLRRLYTRLVLVCEALDAQIEAARAAAEAAQRAAAQQRRTGGAAAAPPPPERPAAPSGNLPAFAEAHRIIVMDAVRTDLRAHPADPPGNSGAFGTGAGGGGGARGGGGGGGPTVTVLPVSVGDGLPELMLVDPPEPAPAEAVASGRLPLWRSALAEGTVGGAAHVPPAGRRLMLRLVNVLSAYAVHDPETGYCQGMSDLAAVFVQLLDDDALAFACFERLMRGARQNFRHDEAGIAAQLRQVGRVVGDTDPALGARLAALGAADCTFAYRMVVVMLRRELPLREVLVLWEAAWATAAGGAAEAAAAGAAEAQAPSLGDGRDGSSRDSTPATAGLLSPAAGLASTLASMELAARAAATEGGGGGGGGSAPSSRGSNPKALALAGRPASGNGRRGGGPAAPPPPPDLVLQFVAAVVRSHRARILSGCRDGDDLLRLFNSASIDFWTALAQARKQHKAYAQGIAVMRRL
jgi:hypothetical protein